MINFKMKNEILVPFCIFFIVIGIGNFILIPLIAFFFLLEKETFFWLYSIFWSLATLISFLFAIRFVHYSIQQGRRRTIGYFFVIIVYFVLSAVPFLQHDINSYPKTLFPKYIRQVR
jgi:hypothetical protein